MNELQTCMCFVAAILLVSPVVAGSSTQPELRLVAFIVLCVAWLMLTVFAVLIML